MSPPGGKDWIFSLRVRPFSRVRACAAGCVCGVVFCLARYYMIF